jgi:hypothetical protein
MSDMIVQKTCLPIVAPSLCFKIRKLICGLQIGKFFLHKHIPTRDAYVHICDCDNLVATIKTAVANFARLYWRCANFCHLIRVWRILFAACLQLWPSQSAGSNWAFDTQDSSRIQHRKHWNTDLQNMRCIVHSHIQEFLFTGYEIFGGNVVLVLLNRVWLQRPRNWFFDTWQSQELSY